MPGKETFYSRVELVDLATNAVNDLTDVIGGRIGDMLDKIHWYPNPKGEDVVAGTDLEIALRNLKIADADIKETLAEIRRRLGKDQTP